MFKICIDRQRMTDVTNDLYFQIRNIISLRVQKLNSCHHITYIKCKPNPLPLVKTPYSSILHRQC